MLRMLLLITMLCAPLAAQGTQATPAPELATRYWINPPTFSALQDLRGDVVLIKAWGKNCKDSMRQLPDMNRYAATPGLHVVTLYAQAHKLEEIEALVKEHDIKYPIALDGFMEVGYAPNELPHVWVVGVDGSIKFSGLQGFHDVMNAELQKVRYPGLGRAKFSAALEPAAKLFVEGEFAKAYAAAEKVYDETDSRSEEDEADWIMKRIDQRMNSLVVRAETAEVLRDYDLAMRCWTELARFKGLDDAAEAHERLNKIKESKKAGADIVARRALVSLMLGLDVEFQSVDDADPAAVRAFRMKCMESYTRFAADNAETGAAERAEELVATFKRILDIRDEPAKPSGSDEG